MRLGARRARLAPRPPERRSSAPRTGRGPAKRAPRLDLLARTGRSPAAGQVRVEVRSRPPRRTGQVTGLSGTPDASPRNFPESRRSMVYVSGGPGAGSPRTVD